MKNDSAKIYISQGEHRIGTRPDQVIATLLGSCVSACIWDPVADVGGMNHVLFTDETENAARQFGHGVNGMELLINGLLRKGASRMRLQAKVFGGASMIAGLTDAGSRNGEFVVDYLAQESIAHIGGDLGGSLARRVEFWPSTGRARMKFVKQKVVIQEPVELKTNEVELF